MAGAKNLNVHKIQGFLSFIGIILITLAYVVAAVMLMTPLYTSGLTAALSIAFIVITAACLVFYLVALHSNCFDITEVKE